MAYDAAYEGLGLVRDRFVASGSDRFGPDPKSGGGNLPLCSEVAKAKQITEEVKSAQDRQIRATTALSDSPRATVVAPGIDQHAILP